MATLREIFERYPPGPQSHCPLGAVALAIDPESYGYPDTGDAVDVVMAWLYPEKADQAANSLDFESSMFEDAPFDSFALVHLLESVMGEWDMAEALWSPSRERQARMRRACLMLADGLKDFGCADRVGDITEASLIDILGHEK